MGGANNDAGTAIIQCTDGGYAVTGLSDTNDILLGGGWPSLPRNFPSSNTPGMDFMLLKLDPFGGYQWHTFRGGNASLDTGRSLVQTSDGGYLVAGETSNGATWSGAPLNPYNAGYDIALVKFDGLGAPLWNTFFGGTGDDYAFNLKTTTTVPLDEYALAGYTTSGAGWPAILPISGYKGNEDGIVVSFTQGGLLNWYTFIGTPGFDRTYALDPAPGDGLIITGYSNYGVTGTTVPIHAFAGPIGFADIMLIKLLPTGNFYY